MQCAGWQAIARTSDPHPMKRALQSTRSKSLTLRSNRRHRLKRQLKSRRLRLEPLERRLVLASTPVISEFLASNSDGLRDSDGDSSDWIEIYNPTNVPFDLSGWSLTDDANDINQWTFPSLTIEPDAFLVVFASGKDRSVVGQELHTNFQLTSDGELLGLYQPNGEAASLYAPQYPVQATNFSYGIDFRTERPIEAGDQARYLVPGDDSLGGTWQSLSFNDTAWASGATGLGYGVIQPGFEVSYYKAQASGAFDGTVNSLEIAREVINTPAYQALVVHSSADVINHQGSGGGGRYVGDQPFPTQSIGVDINHFVFQAKTSIDIPSPGAYSFGVNSDDGFELTISRGATVFTSEFPNPRGAADTIQTFNFTEAGSWDVELIMYEAAGGSSVELFAAAGTYPTFNASVFDLVGDVTSGGLSAAVPYVAGASDLVLTDISAPLQGINSSAYVRMPFQISDPSSLDALRLSMRYDDGFVASINGVEVARRNAPVSLAFNSQATSSRDPSDVRIAESITLPASAISALVEGTNVLTIHGLNRTSVDESFLVLPELSASGLLEGQLRHFTTPTPGEPNQDSALGIVQRVTASVAAGFYESPFNVTLSSTTIGATIRYTTDGTEPSETNGMLYGGAISVTGTTTLRAIAIKADHASLASRTWTYLFLDDVLTQSNDGVAPPGWPATWNANVVDYGIDPDVISLEGMQAVKDALLAIPSWSITTDLDNLFDPGIGIYSNANEDGDDWERPASVELLQPGGSAGFQVNAGLRIRGGFSRSNSNPKHSFRLFFRGAYGDAELEYPVHGTEGTDSFKKLDLRTAQNYSWSFQGSASNNFVADVLARYNQRDLGQPYTRSSWLHLYLNGQYWGLFQTQERAEANFAATYLGGDADDYDVLKPERGPYANIATDGEFGAYDRLFNQALARAGDGITPAFVDDAKYLQAQGLNPDGTRNPAYEVLLDVDNLIAYMITILQGGNLDAPISNFLGNSRINNHFSIRDRTDDEGFRFFIHDSEHTLLNINENRNGPYNHANFESSVNYFNPQWLHQQLMANDEYRLQFADKVQAAFFHDGPLTAASQIAKLNAEASKIDAAIIAESARWGDAKREVPFLRSDWLNAIAGLRNNFFPNRNANLINQFRSTQLWLKDEVGDYTIAVPAPLFPSLDAPEYEINGQLQSGGQVPAGSGLRMTAAAGTIYYTVDGSDPRLPGGAINPDAIVFDSSVDTDNLLGSGSAWKYHDLGVDLGQSWRNPAYNDSAWASGNAQLGYGDGDETTTVSFGSDAGNKFPTTYFRKTFNVSVDDFTRVNLRVRRDDGFIAFLNGVEVARDNLPSGLVSYGTFASALATDDGNAWIEFAINPALINNGSNTLAVEIHQLSGTSSDISFDAEVVAITELTTQIILDNSLAVKARTLDTITGTWSAVHSAGFIVPQEPASAANLRVTELNYNPAGSDDTEFIELANISSGSEAVIIDLGSVTITDGPSTPFVLSATATLGPGEHGVIVRDRVAFLAAYPGFDPALILGEFLGALDNGGERIRLVDASGAELFDFDYDDADPWSLWADGVGGSLVLHDAGATPADQLGKPYHWRGSTLPGGSPGAADPAPLGIVINEVLAHTDTPDLDTIELYNTTASDVDISGWYLSDSSADLFKFAIPAGTIISAGGYITFDESDFNPTPQTPGPNDFALSGSHGDSIWLVVANAAGTAVVAFSDHVELGATFNGVTLGRQPEGIGRLIPLGQPSLGAPNGAHATAEVVVTEIQYHPDPPSASAIVIDPTITESDLEFLEVYNHGSTAVDLTNWRIRGSGDFDFLAGQMIEAGGLLVAVPFDPTQPLNVARVAAFRAHYGIDATVQLVGPFLPSLGNSYGLVELQKPDEAPVDEPTVLPRVLVDEVLYDDLMPWPVEADGSGMSLQRARPVALGNDAGSWRAATPSPGAIRFVPQVESVTINAGANTRSAVTSLELTFDSLIEFPAATAFSLTNQSSGQAVTGISASSSDVGGKTVTTLTFTPGTSVIERNLGENTLADGSYLLAISASGIVARTGAAPLDDTELFGDDESDEFFRKYGDHNGDGGVGLLDFAALRRSFGLASGDSEYFGDLDSDGDGVISLLDFGAFRRNFGT